MNTVCQKNNKKILALIFLLPSKQHNKYLNKLNKKQLIVDFYLQINYNLTTNTKVSIKITEFFK